MESQCLKIKIKHGMTDVFLEWAEGLSGRLDEVKEALASEGLLAELLLIERGENADYALLYTKGKDLAASNLAFEKSTLKIDCEAKEIMAKTWDFSSARVLRPLLEVFEV